MELFVHNFSDLVWKRDIYEVHIRDSSSCADLLSNRLSQILIRSTICVEASTEIGFSLTGLVIELHPEKSDMFDESCVTVVC